MTIEQTGLSRFGRLLDDMLRDEVNRAIQTHDSAHRARISHEHGDLIYKSHGGKACKVRDLPWPHMGNIVARILHELSEGRMAYMAPDGTIEFAPLYRELVDGRYAVVTNVGETLVTKPEETKQ